MFDERSPRTGAALPRGIGRLGRLFVDSDHASSFGLLVDPGTRARAVKADNLGLLPKLCLKPFRSVCTLLLIAGFVPAGPDRNRYVPYVPLSEGIENVVVTVTHAPPVCHQCFADGRKLLIEDGRQVLASRDRS